MSKVKVRNSTQIAQMHLIAADMLFGISAAICPICSISVLLWTLHMPYQGGYCAAVEKD